MSGPLFFSFIGSLVICMALIPALMATANRLQFVDFPGDRKIHHAPVAKVGGLAFAAGTFVTMLLWAPKDPIITSSLIGGIIILLFGAWDDRVGLGYKAKFVGQLIAATIVVWFGGVHLSSLPFLGDLTPPTWIVLPTTLLLLIAVTNALNLADGLDGLAGGLSLLSFGGMAFLAYLSSDVVVMSMMVPVLGGLLGFLRFNTYPARIFMGDAGSQFLGFYLGVCAIVLMDPTRGPYSPALLSFILGLPILDTAGVMVQRLAERRSPFVADKNHVHHKLLAIGLSHREAVLSIYAIQAALITLAYVLRWQSDLIILLVYGAFACAIMSLFVGRANLWCLLSRRAETDSTPDESRTVEKEWYSTLPVQLIGLTIPTFLAAAVFLPREVPSDLGYVALGLFLLMLSGLVIAPTARPMLVRTGLYIGATFVIYLIEQSTTGAFSHIHGSLNIFFLGLTVLIMLAIRFGGKHRFQTTPLDHLMVFLAFAIPFLPEMRIGEINLSVLTAKMIVMFLGFELMLHALSERLIQFGLVSLWVLFMLGLRAWW